SSSLAFATVAMFTTAGSARASTSANEGSGSRAATRPPVRTTSARASPSRTVIPATSAGRPSPLPSPFRPPSPTSSSEIPDLPFEPCREASPRLGDPRGQKVARPETLVGAVLLQDLLRDRHLVHLGRPVGDAHHRDGHPHVHERHL